MIAPGTPALDLPAFAAPSFTAAAVALGAVITDVRFESLSQVDQRSVPFTFAQTFVEGSIAPTDGLAGRQRDGQIIPLQAEHKATHVDGSVRHCVISGVLPFAAAASEQGMDLLRVAKSALASFPVLGAAPVIVQITQNGIVYTAKPTTKAYLSHRGAVMSEVRDLQPMLDSTGNAHPKLKAQVSVRQYHGTGHVRTDVVFENCDAFADYFDVAFDAKVLDAKSGAVLLDWPAQVWATGERHRRLFWHGGAAPQLHIKQNTAYLIRSLQVPEQDQTVEVSEVYLATMAKDLTTKNFGPGGFGRFNPSMPTAGGRSEIAMMPDSYATALLTMDKRAYSVMMASADVAGSWPIHFRDPSDGPAGGHPIDVFHWPALTIIANTNVKNPLTGQLEKIPARPSTYKSVNPGQADVAHQPAFAYLPYLLTGDQYYLDELHFWNNYNAFSNNPAYRGMHRGWLHRNQVRGQAWGIRTLAETLAITPDDHHLKAALAYQFDQNVQIYLARYLDKTVRPDGSPLPAPDKQDLLDQVSDLGYLCDGYACNYTMPNLPGAPVTPNGTDFAVGVGPWQDDFATSSWNHAFELTKHPGALRFLGWKCRFVMERFAGVGACFVDSCVSMLRVRDLPGMPLYKTIAECVRKTVGEKAYALPCNSVERLAFVNVGREPYAQLKVNELYNYPDSPTGYAAQMQGALAAAVNIGYPGARAAWEKYQTRGKKQLYDTGPQFAIVPRPVALAVPTPVPDPVVVTPPVVPTPTPPPAPDPVVPPVVTPPPVTPVPVGASVSLFNERLATGEEYVVTVTKANGQILAVQFPIVAR